MKKILYCFILTITMCGLSACSADQHADMEVVMDIEFTTGEYYNKNWEATDGTYEGNVIADKETAVGVALQIFNGMSKPEAYSEYIVQSVFYDDQDGVWIVSFGKNDGRTDGVIEAGGGCSIALAEEDGKVLRIWFGE